MVRMNRLSAAAIASIISNGGVFVGAERYTVYFIRHADSVWNAYNDKTEVGEAFAREMFTPDKCETYEIDRRTDQFNAGKIKRGVVVQGTNTFGGVLQQGQMMLLQKYVDAGLSPRGEWQSECLGRWIETTCPASGSEAGLSFDETDACRLAGVVDRERAVFAVSNLVRTQDTMQLAFKSTRCKDDAPTETPVHVFDWLQERGCAPDARPASAAGDSAPAAPRASSKCPFDFSEAKSDICTKSTVEQNNVYDKMMQFVKSTADARDSTKPPIFFVTGHSTWLQEFFRAKLPVSSVEIQGKYRFQDLNDKLGPNDNEIKLTKQKLGNASVLRFEVEIGEDVSKSFIVPGVTKLVYGYFKAEK